MWGYDGGVPETEDDLQLMEAAPRFGWKTCFFQPAKNMSRPSQWFEFEHRWNEYKFLYNETPPASWFGWKFYNDSIPVAFRREAMDNLD